MDFFTRFTREKAPQNYFSSQIVSVENNYCGVFSRVKRVKKSTIQLFKSKSQFGTFFFQMRWKTDQDMTPRYFSIEFRKIYMITYLPIFYYSEEKYKNSYTKILALFFLLT